MHYKVCSRCGKRKLRSEFFKCSDRPSGVQSRCKQCQTQLARNWDSNNRDHVNTRQRAARAGDPERYKKYDLDWRINNTERSREISAKTYAKRVSTPEGKRQHNEQSRQWRSENPERSRENHKRWRDSNPKRLSKLTRKANKRYRERHPEVLREIETARKRAKQACPNWADRDKMRVVYQKSKEYSFEVDHIVPLKHPLVSGLHVWHNLQLLERRLNRAKRNKTWPNMPKVA